MSPLIEVRHRRGIHLPEADLWLDPRFPVERAFVSHAHADHFARHRLSLGSAVTRELVRPRFGAEGEFQALPLRETQPWGDWQLRLLPAGHIPGSALIEWKDLAVKQKVGDKEIYDQIAHDKEPPEPNGKE